MLTLDDRLAAAAAHLDGNRSDEAEALYRDILASNPRSGPAMAGLGAILLKRGAVDEAFEVLGRATTLDPGNPEPYENLSLVYRLRDEHDAARTCLEAALSAAPDRIPARLALAEVMIATGDRDGALREIETAYQAEPQNPKVLVALGGAHALRGDLPKAIGCYVRALEADPACCEAHVNLATVYADTGRPKVALEHAERAVLAEPLNPAFIAVLAGALEEADQIERAARLVDRALVLHPHMSDLHRRKASLLVAAGHVDEALATIAKALKADRTDPALLETMASLLLRAGRPDQALLAAQECLRHAPDAPIARRIERTTRLLLGRFDEVWGGSETAGGNGAPTRLRVHLDERISPLETVALLRAIPVGQAAGHDLDIAAPSWLAPLAARVVHGGANAAPADQPPEEPDREVVPLLALPGRLKLDPGTLNGADPYLVADPEKAAMWQEAVAGMPRPLIGFTWAPFGPVGRLKEVRSLLRKAGGTPVSLVWDHNRVELATVPEAIDAGKHIEALDDVVAAVSVLDAVVGVDGVPLHIAGALGIPGVAIVPRNQAWYWRTGDDTRAAWYPTIRVAEAAPGEAWESVEPRAEAALLEHFQAKWKPVGGPEMRQNEGLEPFSDSMKS